jgi:hypothetical protein
VQYSRWFGPSCHLACLFVAFRAGTTRLIVLERPTGAASPAERAGTGWVVLTAVYLKEPLVCVTDDDEDNESRATEVDILSAGA